MHEPIEQVEYRGYIIEIFPDNSPENPREWDNLGTMICKHRRYSLGDVQAENTGAYSSWDEYFEYEIEKKIRYKIISYPLYLLDHSGLRMNIEGFNDCDPHGWDWGQVGFIYCTYEDMRNWFGVKKITKKHVLKAKEILRNEVYIYDCFLINDVAGFQIFDVNECMIESTYGYYPESTEHVSLPGKSRYQYVIDECKAIIDNEIQDRIMKRGNKIRGWIKNHVPLHHRKFSAELSV